MRYSLATALVLASFSPALAIDDAPWDPPPGSTAKEICTDAINAKKQQLLQQGINLGASTGSVHMVSNSFCWQPFQSGRIHSGATSSSSTVAIYGAALARYASLGYETGFGQAFTDPVLDPATGARTSRFAKGHIVAHPTFGTRTIHNPLSTMWSHNATYMRLKYPTAEQVANPFGLGSSQMFERGYIARTEDLGTWIDFTGAGEGRVFATAQLYQHSAFTGTTLAYALSGESPIALRQQLGALDNQVSSLTLKTPTRTSLYIYDLSPLDGRFVRITGADNSKIRVSAIGSWMNDRPSSMMLVNHGSVSARTTLAELTSTIKSELDNLPTEQLLRDALASHNASGSLTWNNDLAVTLIPGERLLQISRSAYLDINAGCVGFFNCNADGNVMFTMALRPYVVMIPNPSNPAYLWPSVHMDFVEGDAISMSCNGAGCDDRNAALAYLLSPGGSTADMIEGKFSQGFDAAIDDLSAFDITSCPGFGVRRVNVIPGALEFVLGDSAAQADCAAADLPPAVVARLDFARPQASITNGSIAGGAIPAFDGTFTVVTDFDLPVHK